MKKYFLLFLVALSALIIFKTLNVFYFAKPNVRECAVCGYFYPKDEAILKDLLKELFLGSKKTVYKVRALIVPHAGYVYSGKIAALGFKQLENEKFKKVIIIAPSHYSFFRGVSIPNYTHYQTPLGLVKVSKDASLLRKIFGLDFNAHLKEHSIEVELPFLQYLFKNNFEIIPILASIANYEEVAREIEKFLDEETVIVVSTDFSHYHDYATAIKLDEWCINQILILNISGIKECEACGKIPILILAKIAKEKGWKPFLIAYANSGDVTGNYEKVVGYAAIAFYEIPKLSKKEREFLLSLARRAIKSKLFGEKLEIDESKIPQNLKKKFGCFVTLKKFGELRGCIGDLFPRKELYKCVASNAINAAFNDIRFNPLTREEFNEIKIEISILTLPIKLTFKSKEFLKFLEPFRHGVILVSGNRQATYLPEVWHQIPDKVLFLESLCRKAGLEKSCWKWHSTTFYVYEAVSFKE